MQLTILKSKIHRATVTGTDLNYEGSVSIDPNLMKAAKILPYELVQVMNLNNGERFETYAIEGEAGSGSVMLNGPAARLATVGDMIIIVSYVILPAEEAARFKPTIIPVDSKNRPIR